MVVSVRGGLECVVIIALEPSATGDRLMSGILLRSAVASEGCRSEVRQSTRFHGSVSRSV